MVASELVKRALCFIILMVSLSKCEIDSSAPKGVEPLRPPPPEESSSVFPTFSSSEAIKTSISTSTSSSSGGDGVGIQLERKVVPPPSPTPDNVYPNNIEQKDQSSNIISTTISPSVASQILTSFHAPRAEQEVLGKMGDEVLKEQQQQQRQPPPRENKFMNQFQDNNNNKQEASSSFSGTSKRDKMSGIGTPVPVSTAAALVVPKAKGASTTFSRNSEKRRSSSSLSSFPGKPGEPGFSRENVGEELISYNENNANSDYSPIPRHTWIPAGLTFSCRNRVPGYYADASAIAKCQVYHMCMTDGRKYTMLCGVGTVFNQLTFVCDHWYNYLCSEAESDYKINSQLWEDVIGDDESVEEEDDHDNNNSDGSQNQENGSRSERVIEEDGEVRPISSRPPPQPFTLTFDRISKSRSALS